MTTRFITTKFNVFILCYYYYNDLFLFYLKCVLFLSITPLLVQLAVASLTIYKGWKALEDKRYDITRDIDLDMIGTHGG